MKNANASDQHEKQCRANLLRLAQALMRYKDCLERYLAKLEEIEATKPQRV